MPRARRRSRSLAYILLASAIVAAGCDGEDEPEEPRAAPSAPAEVRVKTLLTQLQDKDAKVRENALKTLQERAKVGFAPRDGVRLLQEAGRLPPDGPYAIRLIWAAGNQPGPDDVPAILDAFAHYNGGGKAAALSLLAQLPEREAAEAMVRLVRSQGPDSGSGKVDTDPIPWFPVGSLVDQPRHPEVFFPALLDQLGRVALQPGILRIAASYAQQGLLDVETLKPFGDRLVKLLDDELADHPEPDEEDDDERYDVAANLVDLLAILPGPATETSLRRALVSSDPNLLARAALALVRHGVAIAPETLSPAAEEPELRLWLWKQLRVLGETDLLPDRFRTQEALAESELAAWLSRNPTLFRGPRSIEPMGVYPTLGRMGRRQVFLFRFRVVFPKELVERGWMAGWVAYPPDQEPSLGGEVSSHFTPWDDRSTAGHVAASQGVPAGSEDD